MAHGHISTLENIVINCVNHSYNYYLLYFFRIDRDVTVCVSVCVSMPCEWVCARIIIIVFIIPSCSASNYFKCKICKSRHIPLWKYLFTRALALIFSFWICVCVKTKWNRLRYIRFPRAHDMQHEQKKWKTYIVKMNHRLWLSAPNTLTSWKFIVCDLPVGKVQRVWANKRVYVCVCSADEKYRNKLERNLRCIVLVVLKRLTGKCIQHDFTRVQ